MNSEMEIYNKNHLKIIITDSGLGGLSVQALLDNELRKRKIGSDVELIYYNSLAHHDYGYNTILEYDEKVRVFDSAISGMLKFNPDIILIACNTLSVLYFETEISKLIKIPVIGIVDLGVELIMEEIKRVDESNIILFGTGTTINSNQHKNKLLSRGIISEQIISQACEFLESEIQLDPKSEQVKNLIEKYVDAAFGKIQKDIENTFAVLCCTHYSYSIDIFQKTLNKKLGKNVFILNPNKKMADTVANGFKIIEKVNFRINNLVYSRVEIYKSEIEKLSELLSKDSQSVSTALKNYKLDRELFII